MVKKLNEEIDASQAGYMKHRGTRDHIFNLQITINKCLEMQQNLVICFVDYSKAFDNARYRQLWPIMLKMGFPPHVVRLIGSLYKDQQSAVKLKCGTTDWFNIGKGVRQGCILSPALFNIYTENIMREVMDEEMSSNYDLLDVGGEVLSDLRYADDAALISKSRSGLSRFVESLNDQSEKHGLKMNAKKTKVMPISRERPNDNPETISVGGSSLDEVGNFMYLGARIQSDGDNSKEIRSRLALGLKALNGMKKLWRGQDKGTKIRILRACVFPVATYACETWVLRTGDENNITAFENKCYRRILRVPWTQHRTNDSIRQELEVNNEWLLQYVRKQKLSYFGHIKRRDGMEKRVLEAYIPGRRRRGRPRCSWQKTMVDAFGSMQQAGRLARDRKQFRNAVREATL
jgi:hypothetical protein